jgi:hypothetical protein
MTVIEAATLCVSVAVTVAALTVVVAKARQISAVPVWALVLSTRVQVKLPPVTPLTETLVPVPEASAVMNVNKSSFGEAVVNDGDTIVLALVERLVDWVTSTAMGTPACIVKLAVTLALVIGVAIFGGVNV